MASELIVRKMYAGLYDITHNPNARGRAPRYVVTDTKTGEMTKPKGTTTILGQTLSKDLMAWAVACATEYLKGKLPTVTQEDLDVAAAEYTRKRDAGASTGTEAHALVEKFLKKAVEGEYNEATGMDGVIEASQEAQNAYYAFAEWFNLVEPEILNVEEVVYSQRYEYAGTYDCMLRIDGRNYLCDLKTTNASRKAPRGIYAEYFIQLGAYAGAHNEERAYEIDNNGDSELPKIDGLMVISAKKNGKLDIVTNEDLGLTVETCSDMFYKVANINKFLTSTTKKLGG